MADPASLADIAKTAGVGVGGLGVGVILTQLLGGLLKGWISGTAGQERELRNDLAEERSKLQAALTAAHAETDEARADVRRIHAMYLVTLTGRAEARGALKACERAAGLPETQWPDDPVIPLNSPGGTP
ncbi:hypothetical protein [Deinococcus sp. UYEF24]